MTLSSLPGPTQGNVLASTDLRQEGPGLVAGGSLTDLRALEPVPPETLQVFDDCRPTLVAGHYRVTTTQDIAYDEGQDPTTEPGEQRFVHKLDFLVDGSRFQLEPGDVHDVFPPADSQAPYGLVLPHIVLSRPRLPWLRTIPDVAPQTVNPPWLALLVLSEDELLLDGTEPAEGSPNPTRSRVRPIAEVLRETAPEDDILRPDLRLDAVEQADPELAARTVEIDPATFLAVVPRVEELRFLAHCRQVSTADKELLDQEIDGLFSLVVASRTPPADVRSIVHLVSLEGFGAELPTIDGPAPDLSAYDRVRLVTLASWAFESVSRDGCFRALMQGLDSACFVLGAPSESSLQLDSLGARCARPFPDSSLRPTTALRASEVGAPEVVTFDAEAYVEDALGSGYVPLEHVTREGEQTLSWFRGPLLPVLLEAPPPEEEPLLSFEAALIYDPDTGLFDTSYAVAWQLGRLLALRDRQFAGELTALRREIQRRTALERQRARVQERFGGLLEDPQAAHGANARDLMEAWITRVLAPAVRDHSDLGSTDPLLPAVTDATGILGRLDRYPGVLRPTELMEALRAGFSPDAALAATLESEDLT